MTHDEAQNKAREIVDKSDAEIRSESSAYIMAYSVDVLVKDIAQALLDSSPQEIMEEEIEKASNEYAYKEIEVEGVRMTQGNLYYAVDHFEAGAKWAMNKQMKWPSDEELLEANNKYVKANWMKHDPKGSLEHAYYHGQMDLIEWLKEKMGVKG